MPHEIVLDMSEEGKAQKITRKRAGSLRDIAKYWHTRYGAFLKDGFIDEEAKWGADNGLSLKNKTVKKVRVHRRALVKYYMRHNNTRMRAIELASYDLEETLQLHGITEKNIFYELYISFT